MCCWNLAVNCQYNIRLGVRQAHDRYSEAQRHFPLVHIQVQLLMTTIADHHHVVDVWACALLQKHQRTILFPASIFTRILSAYNTLSLWLSVFCSVRLCWEQNIDYEFWPDMSKISYCTLGKFLLHTYQLLLHTLWRKTHYFRPCPPCRNPVKSVPRGKAIWNANGGFVSVLLTHLLLLLLLLLLLSEKIWC